MKLISAKDKHARGIYVVFTFTDTSYTRGNA